MLGFVAVPLEGDPERVHADVLYRSEGVRKKLGLVLERDDARALGQEVDALLHRRRVRPLHFEVLPVAAGGCEVFRVTG